MLIGGGLSCLCTLALLFTLRSPVSCSCLSCHSQMGRSLTAPPPLSSAFSHLPPRPTPAAAAAAPPPRCCVHTSRHSSSQARMSQKQMVHWGVLMEHQQAVWWLIPKGAAAQGVPRRAAGELGIRVCPPLWSCPLMMRLKLVGRCVDVAHQTFVLRLHGPALLPHVNICKPTEGALCFCF